MKAVIPVAGLGSRFSPITKAVPKEMLPIVDTPIVELIINEAFDSGIEEVILVTSERKKAIEQYFAGRDNIKFIYQDKPLGLGHAILCAEKEIGREAFAILLGDDLVDAREPVTKQMIKQYNTHKASILTTGIVQNNETKRYGIVESMGISLVANVLEKPEPKETTSRLGIVGRYIMTPGIFECLREIQPGKNNELQLTDAIKLLLFREQIHYFQYDGIRYDVGHKLDYIAANIGYALKRPELREYLELMLKKEVYDRLYNSTNQD